MKQEIINTIAENITAHKEWASAIKDFEYDKESLKDWEGDFVMVAYKYGTSLCKLDHDFNNPSKYIINQISKNGCCLQHYYNKDAIWFVYIAGNLKIYDNPNVVKVVSFEYADECEKRFKGILEDMRNKQRFYIKCPDERYMQALKLSYEHNDKTFMDCINRMIAWTDNSIDSRIELYSDFAENSFAFSQIDYETGKVIMNGGLIFHGFPDEGYKENGSCQMSPEYGWQIHT